MRFAEDIHGWLVTYEGTFIGRLVDIQPPSGGDRLWYWRDAGEFSLRADDLRQVVAKLDELNALKAAK